MPKNLDIAIFGQDGKPKNVSARVVPTMMLSNSARSDIVSYNPVIIPPAVVKLFAVVVAV